MTMRQRLLYLLGFIAVLLLIVGAFRSPTGEVVKRQEADGKWVVDGNTTSTTGVVLSILLAVLAAVLLTLLITRLRAARRRR